MPQENKKARGRRQKRKHDEDGEQAVQDGSKRLKPTEDGEETGYRPLQLQDESLDGAYPSVDTPFFGMLDEEEQEYFKRADDMLELNSFGDTEERDLFLSNVYREASGKELKIALSQSCSRLMERLIQLSTSSQLKQLFQAFNGKCVAPAVHSIYSVSLTEGAASLISCHIDSRRIAARHCSCAPHPPSPRSLSHQSGHPMASARMEHRQTVSTCRWRISFYIHLPNWKAASAI